ncbi:MAG: Trehalose utilization [Phycisphaerales bacterium]|nr:Trehalose utilization [Phycisphaerales bacterium]
MPGYDDRMVKEFLKAGYNVVTVNALARWDRVGPSAGLYSEKEAKDADAYLRQIVETVHAGGAKSILYIGPVQVPWLSKEFVAAHPEWLPTGADGKPVSPVNFAKIRGGYADWLCKQLAYVVKTYGVDGFWMDGFAPPHLHTYDDATRDAFAKFSGGKEIPAPGDFDPVANSVARRYLDWHEQYFVELAGRMRAAVREANPDAVIFANHSGCRTWYDTGYNMGEYPLAYSGAIDVSSIELYWDAPGDALYQQFCYAFLQGVTHDRGATTWVQPTEHGVSGVCSPVEIQLRGLEGPPWGVYPEFVESALREEYHMLHANNMKAREAWWENSEALPYVAVVASEQTRRLYGRAAMPAYFSHTLGAFRALFEQHWPVRVLTEYDLESGDLGGARVLVLANVACLSDRAAEVVRRFVAQGGGLVATLETSLTDSDYQRRPDFALGDLLHAKYVKTLQVEQRDQTVRVRLEGEHPITSGALLRSKQATAWTNPAGPPTAAGPLMLIAACAQVQPTEGGQVVATFESASADAAGAPHPAIITSSFGKGRVVYFPAGVDKAMYFFPDAYLRQLLASAVRWSAGDVAPPVEVHGPLLLSTTFRRQPAQRRVIVHLLNDHSSYGRHSVGQRIEPLPKEIRARYGLPASSELHGQWPIREEVIPLHDITVRCRVPGITRATQQPEGLNLPITRTADGIVVTVPNVGMHSMVVFEGE